MNIQFNACLKFAMQLPKSHEIAGICLDIMLRDAGKYIYHALKKIDWAPSYASHTAYKGVSNEDHKTSALDFPAAYSGFTLVCNPPKSTQQYTFQDKNVADIKDTTFCQVCLDIMELGKAYTVKVADPIEGHR